MSGFSDLNNRVVYAVLIAVVGVACLVTKLSAGIFIALLLIGYTYEVANKLLNSSAVSVKTFVVTMVLAIIGDAGFVCAYVIRTNMHGFYDVLLIAAGIVATDSLAYIGGRKFGRRKLAPKISPNKTIEGTFCGVMAGMITLLAAWAALKISGNTSLSPLAILLAMTLPTIAVLGDLLESWTKRLLGIKDFGKIFGAHGGFADRFDSYTVSFVVLEVIILIAS